MKVNVLEKHLKNADYRSNDQCPLAKALRSMGYTKIIVGGFSTSVVKNNRSLRFEFDHKKVITNVESMTPFTIDLKRISIHS